MPIATLGAEALGILAAGCATAPGAPEVQGAAPDSGAYKLGVAVPHYGPRGP